MITVFPKPEQHHLPSNWPQIILFVTTILLEAESEPYEGKLAVAWVIRNRMDIWKQTIRQVILGKDELVKDDGHPYEVFSCWNDDYEGMRTARLVAIDQNKWEE